MFNNQVDFMNQALTFMQKFQNFRRNMLINYNPSWGLVNPLRDIQTGLAFAISELDSKGGRLGARLTMQLISLARCSSSLTCHLSELSTEQDVGQGQERKR